MIFHMKYFIEIVLILFAITTECLAWEVGKDIPVASDAITFEQNFDDKSTNPEMAVGKAKPIHIFGKIKFVKGIKGNALFCGENGSKIRYLLKDNIDFSKAGTVSFWFFTYNWQDGAGKHRTLFFATESSKGYIGAQIANGPKKKSPLERKIRLRILYSAEIPDCILSLPPLSVKANNKWHFMAFAWSANKIFMSLDGASFSSKTLPNKISTKALPSTHFSIGSNDSQNYFLDELKIYSRKLSDLELKKIWIKYNKKGMKK